MSSGRGDWRGISGSTIRTLLAGADAIGRLAAAAVDCTPPPEMIRRRCPRL